MMENIPWYTLRSNLRQDNYQNLSCVYWWKKPYLCSVIKISYIFSSQKIMCWQIGCPDSLHPSCRNGLAQWKGSCGVTKQVMSFLQKWTIRLKVRLFHSSSNVEIKWILKELHNMLSFKEASFEQKVNLSVVCYGYEHDIALCECSATCPWGLSRCSLLVAQSLWKPGWHRLWEAAGYQWGCHQCRGTASPYIHTPHLSQTGPPL